MGLEVQQMWGVLMPHPFVMHLLTIMASFVPVSFNQAANATPAAVSPATCPGVKYAVTSQLTLVFKPKSRLDIAMSVVNCTSCCCQLAYAHTISNLASWHRCISIYNAHGDLAKLPQRTIDSSTMPCDLLSPAIHC